MDNILIKKCVMLSFLIFILSIYSTIVFADLTSIEARGQDNAKNIIRDNDFILFKVTASITGDSDITPDQVLLGSSLGFDECIAGLNAFDCTLRFPSEGTNSFDATAIPFTITLKNDDGNIVETKSDNLFVDNLPPELNSFEVDRPLVSSGTLRFSYSINDEACSASSCSGKCSGIKEIRLFEIDGNFDETITINSQSCSFSDDYDTQSQFFTEGDHVIFAQAFDMFGQASFTASTNLRVDTNPPFIDLNTFFVLDSLDENLSFFATSPIPVTIKVDIKDVDLDKDSVFADLNQLNRNINLENVQGECGETDDEVTTCTWNILLDPDGPGSKEITIDASDIADNDATIIILKTFELDDIGPEVLSLTSSRIIDGQSYAKLEGNTFTATFREQGVGLIASNMNLIAASSGFIADSCNLIANVWECTWNNVDFPNPGRVNVLIDTSSTDRLGNNIVDSFTTEVIVDSTKPKLLSLTIKGLSGTVELIEGLTKTGDIIFVEAALQDENIDTAVADFSNFIFNADEVNADACVKTGDKTFVCTWTTSSIDIEGFIADIIRFEFTDISGNTLTVDENFQVLGISDEQTPDFYTSSVSCSPNLFDRETFPLINQRAFCIVTLKPKIIAGIPISDAKPITSSLGECVGNTSLVESFELINNELSSEPIIRINFARQSANVNSIDILCPIDIISVKGTSIVTVPERENIDMNFKFFNQPLGEVSESVQQKIDDAIEDAGGIWDFVGTLQWLNFYAQRICQFLSIYENFVALLEIVTKTIGDTEKSLAIALPGAEIALYNTRVEQCLLTDEAHKKMTEFKETIDPVTGRSSEGGLYPFLSKFCALANCKYTSPFYPDSKWLLTDSTWREDLISTLDYNDYLKNFVGRGGKSRSPSAYMNPKDSIVMSLLPPPCIPGIIHNLNKYRQIQCMYADCLQTGVGKQGLPVFACEDQKEYATCKYVVGELFKIIPHTAVLNYYLNLLKDTLSDPFKIIGAGVALSCKNLCPASDTGESFNYCIVPKILSMLGETLQDVTGIIEQGAFTINDDFCDRLEDVDDDDN